MTWTLKEQKFGLNWNLMHPSKDYPYFLIFSWIPILMFLHILPHFSFFLFTYFKKDSYFSLFLGQLFCSDQQGPHVILAFFTSKDNNKHATKTVTFDLNAETLQEIPMLDKYEVDLSQPVSEIQLFLTAITDYKINNDGNLFHRR